MTPLLYDSSDLVTHAVIAGMTGSGKTGLGIDLIEEAAIDGIPVIAIDPKGDLGNLLLTFPHALGARTSRRGSTRTKRARAGQTPEAFAAAEAAQWTQGPGRMGTGRRAHRSGSTPRPTSRSTRRAARPAGRCRSSSRSRRPDPEILNDPDLLRDRVTTAATSVLTLAGVDAEPMRSREHIAGLDALQRESGAPAAISISRR